MFKNTNVSYGSVAKFFHWLIFLLVIGMLLMGFFMGDIKDKALAKEIINFHKLTGMMILGIMMLRVLWSFSNVKPLLPISTPLWQLFADRVVQILFYVVLIVMPLSGWVMSVAKGHPPIWQGVSFYLPVPRSKALSSTAFDLHVWLAIGIIILITIHVLAALYHFFVKKDDVLQRMLPG